MTAEDLMRAEAKRNDGTTPPRVGLTIAGSDSGGGAFHRFGVYGTSALTLVTAQNTTGVREVRLLPPALVSSQISAVAEDFEVRAVKTGALGSEACIEAVATAIGEHGIPNLVVDPVTISKHGDPLLPKTAVNALKRRLFPGASLVTPNLHEAATLLGSPVESEAGMRDAARAVRDLGARAVLVKGGHLTGDQAIDLLYDGAEFLRLPAPRIETPHTHGPIRRPSQPCWPAERPSPRPCAGPRTSSPARSPAPRESGTLTAP
jgi:hydroxymethylpyrimidine/phosphomethylpyrimidine kinase